MELSLVIRYVFITSNHGCILLWLLILSLLSHTTFSVRRVLRRPGQLLLLNTTMIVVSGGYVLR